MSRFFDVEWHDELSSTNDRALMLAREGADGVAVAAKHQTAGRGRRGRSWSSPGGHGLYVSFVARPPVSAAKSPLLTLLCGVAVHDAFASEVSGVVGLKWPNDVLVTSPEPLAGRKLAGILVESATKGDDLEYVVFGVGINLTRAEHSDPEAASRAVSLSELGVEMIPEYALLELDQALGRRLVEVRSQGLAFVPEAWTERAAGLDEPISVRCGEETLRGRLLGITPDGGLRLGTHAGERHVYSGEVL